MEQGPWSEYAPQPQAKPAGPWDEYGAPVSRPAAQTSGTSTHGALYNAASSVLNSHHEQESTGNGIADKVLGVANTLGEAPMDLVRGTAKGALSTAAGLGSIFNKVTGANQPFNQENLSGLTESHSAAEGAGKIAEQGAELASGEGLVAKGTAKLAGRMAAGGVMSGIQSGGDPTAALLGGALPAAMGSTAAKYAGKAVSKFLGMTTGAGDAAIARAYLHPDSSGLAKVMRGETTVQDVVSNLQTSVKAVRDRAGDSYKQTLAAVKNQTIPNWHAKSGQFVQDLKNELDAQLPKFGVNKAQVPGKPSTVLGPNGKPLPGPTVTQIDTKHLTGAPEAEIMKLTNMLDNWGSEARDFTPAGLDTLKKQIGEVVDESNSALSNRLYDKAKNGLNKIVPGYESMTKDYADSADFLRKMKQEFNVSASGGNNEGTISRKIQTMLKQNTNFRELLMNKMPNGSDLLDQIAGLHLNDVMPKGIMKSLIGAEAIGSMSHVPFLSAGVIPSMAVASPRVIGEGARLAGKVAKSNVPVGNLARRGVTAAVNGQLSGSN